MEGEWKEKGGGVRALSELCAFSFFLISAFSNQKRLALYSFLLPFLSCPVDCGSHRQVLRGKSAVGATWIEATTASSLATGVATGEDA